MAAVSYNLSICKKETSRLSFSFKDDDDDDNDEYLLVCSSGTKWSCMPINAVLLLTSFTCTSVAR